MPKGGKKTAKGKGQKVANKPRNMQHVARQKTVKLPRGDRGGGAGSAEAAYAGAVANQTSVTKDAVHAYLNCPDVVESGALSADLPPAPVGDNQASYRWSTTTYAQLSVNADSADGNYYYGCGAFPVGNGQLRVYKTYTNGACAGYDSYNCEGYSLWAAGFVKIRLAYMSLRVLNLTNELSSSGLCTASCVDAGAAANSRIILEGEHASTTYPAKPGTVLTYPWLGREPVVDYQWVDTSAVPAALNTAIMFQGNCGSSAATTSVRVAVYCIWEGIPLIDTDTLYRATLRPVDRGQFTRYLMAELAIRPVDERRVLTSTLNMQRDGDRTQSTLARMPSLGGALMRVGRRLVGAVRGSQGLTLGQRVMSTMYNLWNEAFPITSEDWVRRVVSMLRPEEFAMLREWCVANPVGLQPACTERFRVAVDEAHPARVPDRVLASRVQNARCNATLQPAVARGVKYQYLGAADFDGDDRKTEPSDYPADRDYTIVKRGPPPPSPTESAARRSQSARR